MAKRNLYLSNTPVEEAIETYIERIKSIIDIKTEEIKVQNSLGRVTALPIYAKLNSPLYNAAAMDGVAVIAAKTASASETNPLRLKKGDDFIVVDTGDPVKLPYDAVIMAEDIVETGEEIEIRASVAPWQHVRPVGEDIVAGEMILPSFHKIRPIDIGVLLSGGINNITVTKKAEVAIIPTGTEIVEPGTDPKDGEIIESNGGMFKAMVEEKGGIGHLMPVVADEYELLKSTIKKAVEEHDLVIVNAGSSAGTEDYTVHILRELGEVIIHGVAIKPGKPVILAIVSGKPVIGLPGYPVSAYIDFESFVTPVLSMLTGASVPTVTEVQGVISRRTVSSLKHKEYVRVKVGRVRDKLVAAPLARGAGAAMSLVRADGFCVIPQNSEGVEAGETVNISLYRSLSDIENTLVLVGSHDLILDVLADQIPNKYKGIHLSSTHVGSLGGLLALKRGEAHVAPTHLLDEDTGEYNISYIKKLFPEEKMVLIKGVNRIQGFIVQPGNPQGIKTIEDLVGKRYVNRQKGAGTRVLLDYKLKLAGISAESIIGYDYEAATHMAVAVAVKNGNADAGLGVYSAAKAMGMDFVEVGSEEYDFAIPADFLELDSVKAFIETMKSEEFRRQLDVLGGYSYERCGEIIEL